MNTAAHLTVRGKVQAFRYAWQGLAYMLATQANAWIQIGVAVVVVAAGLWFGLSAGEWCAVALAWAVIWIAETLNTAIEAVVDLASPDRHPLAGRAKDVAAGAVLVAVAAGALVAVVVFGPRLWALIPA